MNSELYSQVLGKDWHALAENIRCAHSAGREIPGVFRIIHGPGRAARLLAGWSDMPQAADTAETRLNIIQEGAGERWERLFDGKAFATRQWKDKDGYLVERYNEWELIFKLRVEEECLFYDQFAARLCVGALRIPMPRACAPRVSAKEKAEGESGVLVSVTVTMPLLGQVISYEGLLNVKGNSK